MKNRRAKKSAAARVRPFWILIVLLLAAAAACSYYGLGWPGFRVKQIEVAGAAVVNKSEIVQRAAIDRRANLWLQNMGAVVKRIQAIPYIDTVTLHRGLPARLTIIVTERKPYALLADAQDRVLIDEHLRVLEAQSLRTDLPTLRVPAPRARPGEFLHSEVIAALVRDYEILHKSHVEARSLARDRLGDLTVTVDPGIMVKLGDDTDLEQKARLVNPILSQTQQEGKRVRALDLRAPKTPVVIFR
ncbi:MAG: FtsQ-type POTRA domain-containing protein [Candidatus Eremiobacteraeota bacterium]|nr:FtsQ-type POTRA domain-containing protein [Candidatus Eremiobacteraeota bacterium]